jgi:hypothetical protein
MHVINLGKQKGNKYFKLFIQNRNIDITKKIFTISSEYVLEECVLVMDLKY